MTASQPDTDARSDTTAPDPVRLALHFWSAYYSTCTHLTKVTQLWLERRQQALQDALRELQEHPGDQSHVNDVLIQQYQKALDDLSSLGKEAFSIQCEYTETIARTINERIDISAASKQASSPRTAA